MYTLYSWRVFAQGVVFWGLTMIAPAAKILAVLIFLIAINSLMH